jgi:hypothetical protein
MSGTSKSYWLEGLIVGGVVFGAMGAAIASSNCSNSDLADTGSCVDNTLLGALVGAAIGAAPGALIGGLFRK